MLLNRMRQGRSSDILLLIERQYIYSC